jgi:hypothetical protein
MSLLLLRRQGHSPLDKGFAERIFDKVIPAFQRK